MINLSRRGFIFGGAAFAIVSPQIIMPIKALIFPTEPVLLPPGEYEFFIDEVIAAPNGPIWKVIAHKNYGLGVKKIAVMIDPTEPFGR